MEPRLDMIVGPMFAGKTTELLRRQRCLKSLGYEALLVSGRDEVRTHASGLDAHRPECAHVTVHGAVRDLFTHPLYHTAEVILVDEGERFWGLKDDVLRMVERDGKRVVVAGRLARDGRKPFGQIHLLMMHADTIETLRAFCMACGDGTPGLFTCDDRETVCRRHYLLRAAQPSPEAL